MHTGIVSGIQSSDRLGREIIPYGKIVLVSERKANYMLQGAHGGILASAILFYPHIHSVKHVELMIRQLYS